MPLFEYICNKCHFRFDKMVPRWDAQVACPKCQGAVTKLMSSFAVHSSDKSAAAGIPDTAPKMCTNC